MRWVGTNVEGGEFEAIFAGLSLYRGERPVGAELFEVADLERRAGALRRVATGSAAHPAERCDARDHSMG